MLGQAQEGLWLPAKACQILVVQQAWWFRPQSFLPASITPLLIEKSGNRALLFRLRLQVELAKRPLEVTPSQGGPDLENEVADGSHHGGL